MSNTNLIQIQQFCILHEIEYTFISDLKNYGLINIIIQNDDEYLEHEQLPNIEKLIRLHFDLKVNMEGIDIIYNLLEKIENLKTNLKISQNRLRIYEENESDNG